MLKIVLSISYSDPSLTPGFIFLYNYSALRNLIDKESFLVFSIALALAVAGIVSIIASDDLLACFVAGNVFAWE